MAPKETDGQKKKKQFALFHPAILISPIISPQPHSPKAHPTHPPLPLGVPNSWVSAGVPSKLPFAARNAPICSSTRQRQKRPQPLNAKRHSDLAREEKDLGKTLAIRTLRPSSSFIVPFLESVFFHDTSNNVELNSKVNYSCSVAVAHKSMIDIYDMLYDQRESCDRSSIVVWLVSFLSGSLVGALRAGSVLADQNTYYILTYSLHLVIYRDIGTITQWDVCSKRIDPWIKGMFADDVNACHVTNNYRPNYQQRQQPQQQAATRRTRTLTWELSKILRLFG